MATELSEFSYLTRGTHPPWPALGDIESGLRLIAQLPDAVLSAWAQGCLADLSQIRRLSDITTRVAETLHVAPMALIGPSKDQRVAFCRAVSMVMGHQLACASCRTMGRYFGRTHSTVGRILQGIERRRRREPAFDAFLTTLQMSLTAPVALSVATQEAVQ